MDNRSLQLEQGIRAQCGTGKSWLLGAMWAKISPVIALEYMCSMLRPFSGPVASPQSVAQAVQIMIKVLLSCKVRMGTKFLLKYNRSLVAPLLVEQQPVHQLQVLRLLVPLLLVEVQFSQSHNPELRLLKQDSQHRPPNRLPLSLRIPRKARIQVPWPLG